MHEYKKIHIVLRNPTRTHPHNPASPESLRTGDILCCIWFEIISNNRWVLFFSPSLPASPALHRRHSWQRKYEKLPTPGDWSNSHLSAHQCCCHQTHLSTRMGFFSGNTSGTMFHFLCSAEALMHVCVFLNGMWSVKCVCVYVGSAATGRQQSGCTI